MTMQVIQHIELGSDQANITFSSIPSTYTDIYIVASLRNTQAFDQVRLSINGSTANITGRLLFGSGSSVGSLSGSLYENFIGWACGTSQTANTFNSIALYIPNYASSSAKSISTDSSQENNGTSGVQSITATLFNSTSAISSVTLAGDGGTWAIGSSATLYGITKGSDGVTTVS